MMKVDTNPFEVSSSFAEPIFISANVIGVEANHVVDTKRMKQANELELDHFEGVEKLIFPVVDESLVNFLSQQHDAKGDVSLCPRCNAVFDRNVARAFEKRRFKREIVEKEGKRSTKEESCWEAKNVRLWAI